MVAHRHRHANPPPGPLAPEEVAAFHDVGFIVVRGLWRPREVAAMARAFDRLAAAAAHLGASGDHRGSAFVLGDRPDGRGAGASIQRVVWCGAAEPILLRYGADPRLVSRAAQLLGVTDLEQLINQAHFKIPGDGVAFPWHQDSRHRRYGTPEWTDVTGRGSFVETLTAVDPMTADNGPLQLIPGSARLGHLATDPRDHALPADRFDPAAAVDLVLAPGDVALFGPYTIHGSAPNEGTRPRRAFLNGYAAAGANRRVYPGRGAGRRLTAG